MPDDLRARLTALPRHTLWSLAERFQGYQGHAEDEYVRWSDVTALLREPPETVPLDVPAAGWTGDAHVLWNYLLDLGCTAAEADALVSVALKTLRPKEPARGAVPMPAAAPSDAETKLRALRGVCHECRRVDADDFRTPALAECIRCGELDCPHNEPLHYHHDGCPACHGTAGATPDTETTITRELRARDHRLGRHPSGSVEECPLCACAAPSEETP